MHTVQRLVFAKPAFAAFKFFSGCTDRIMHIVNGNACPGHELQYGCAYSGGVHINVTGGFEDNSAFAGIGGGFSRACVDCGGFMTFFCFFTL
jgi:hypothetical protein